MRKKYFQIKNISLDKLELAIKESSSYIEVLRKLGCNTENYRNYQDLKRICYDNNIQYDNLEPKLTPEKYYENPKKCKECGKIIPYEKRTNDFCNSSCAAIYNNCNSDKKYQTRKKRTKEAQEKIKVGAQKELRSERTKKYRVLKHNLMIDSKFSTLGIPHINPDCCFICGQPNCTNPFCKKHSFQQLIGLSKVGLNITTIGTTRIFEEFQRVRNLISKQYVEERLTLSELADFYKIKDFSTVRDILNYLGIPRRTKSEALRNSYLTGNMPVNCLGKTQSHITWENTEVALRSSYELEYAILLDNNKIRYEVETLRISYYDSNLKLDRIAIPDFYLPDTNEIIEIKSDYTLDIQEMLDRFSSYKKSGYIPKLILEHEEIDLYNIENLISSERLEKIKTQNIKKKKGR